MKLSAEQNKRFIKNSFTVILVLLFFGCIEPYEGTVEGFDDVLVVNTVITNENKQQEVLLKRSYRFEEEGPLAEENANVIISDGDGNSFRFEEVEPGRYLSIEPFAAELNKNYSLSITTQGGKSYASDTMQLPTASTQIDELYAERTTNDNGEDGMGIFVDTFDPSSSSKYYRYDFIETYKVIAPLWNPYDIVYRGESVFGPQFSVILREREERVCYGSARPTFINLVNTLNLAEDRLTRQKVRFIFSDDYILSHRYSILVKQYVQSSDAFAYYEALQSLIKSSNVFSEDQPGFLAGNLFSIDNTDEKVVGFFEVATVDEKRLFFNYEEYYPGEELPPFADDCIIAERSDPEELKTVVLDGTAVFYDSAPTRTTRRACGDCTVLGSNKIPAFWVE